MTTKAQSVKSKGPAPTVDQINADRITQVRQFTIIRIFFIRQNKHHNYMLFPVSACKSVLGTLYHRKPSFI